MRREWSSEDLVASWTLIGEDWELIGNKSGPTRLGFALVFPSAAVAYVAEQVKVHPAKLAGYRWSGRTIEYHRAQVRDAFGFREFTRGHQ